MSRQVEANSGSSSEYSDYESSCSDEDEQEYEVEKIVGHKFVGGRLQLMVQWVGYDSTENTWEPLSHLKNSQEKVTEYFQKHPEAQTDFQKHKGRKMGLAMFKELRFEELFQKRVVKKQKAADDFKDEKEALEYTKWLEKKTKFNSDDEEYKEEEEESSEDDEEFSETEETSSEEEDVPRNMYEITPRAKRDGEALRVARSTIAPPKPELSVWVHGQCVPISQVSYEDQRAIVLNEPVAETVQDEIGLALPENEQQFVDNSQFVETTEFTLTLDI